MAARSGLTCPRCSKFELVACSYEQYDLDVCERCAGIWLEATDWDTADLGLPPPKPTTPSGDKPDPEVILVRASNVKADSDRVENLRFVETDTSERFRNEGWCCPQCEGEFRLLSVKQVKGLLIDHCSSCGGIWFDQSEWQYIGAARDWLEQRRGIERSPNWGEWFFQLFSRLPVEFNIRPRRLPIVTFAIIAICVLVEILLPIDSYVEYGVRGMSSLTLDRCYTLLTYQFLHAGWIHLLGNMYLLYVLGDNVEDAMGRFKFLTLYLFCGVVAALAEVLLGRHGEILLIGASGSVAGIIAAYLVLFRRARLTFMFIVFQFKLPAWVWIGVWLLIQIGASMIDHPVVAGIAFLAHIGGFVAGLLVVLPIRSQLVRRHPLLYLLSSRRIKS